MARVKLGELVAGELATYYTSTLPTELAAIDTDAADGIILAEPVAGNIYAYEKLEISGGTDDTTASTDYPAHLEIFEDDLTFSDPYSDQNAGRATYTARCNIRLTFFNSKADTKATVETRRRRYSAGLFNVVSKNPTLGDATPLILGVIPREVRYDRDLEAGGMLKQRITLVVDVDVEEVQP